ncbi:MAG: ABC transporter substrate-binding protein, partial [Eubacteriales bacterium]
MKKILSFALALVICVFCFAGCTKIEDDDPNGKGAVIDIYMGTKVYNLDPAIAYTDENTAKILGLIFEGLTRIDGNGGLENALMKEYEIVENEKTDTTEMHITINDTYWSDGSLVQTNDLIYAWKRILDPTFNSEAAPMLFCIKGAYERKLGNIGEDDIGVYSISKNKMVIEFEDGADIDEFLYNLASPALSPVRETKIKTYPDTWSKKSSDLSTNGPFRVKKFSGTDSDVIILERSKYYYLSQVTDNEALDKYVTPYQIVIHYEEPLDRSVVYSENKNVTDIISMIKSRDIFFASGLTSSVLSNFKTSDIKYSDLASTYSYYFNTSTPIGSNAAVRYALSIALDRDAIAEAIGGGADAATGLIPSMIFDTKKGTSFRKKGGDILSSSAKIEEAKTILKDAGVDPSTYEEIYLYYLKDTTNDSYQS